TVLVDCLEGLPLGAGAPIARLVNGALTVDAFPGTPGPMQVTAEDVHSFTIDGKRLPPLIRVTGAGNSVFGTADSDLSVIRIARVNADGQPNFDFSHRPELATRRPIVFTNADFSIGAQQSSVPLVDLK